MSFLYLKVLQIRCYSTQQSVRKGLTATDRALISYRHHLLCWDEPELPYRPCPASVCADGRAAACCGHTAAGTWRTSSQRPACSPPTRWDCGCSEPLDTGWLRSHHWGGRREHEEFKHPDWAEYLCLFVLCRTRKTSQAMLENQFYHHLWLLQVLLRPSVICPDGQRALHQHAQQSDHWHVMWSSRDHPVVPTL